MSDHIHHSNVHGSFKDHQEGELLRDELQNTKKEKEISMEELKTMFAQYTQHDK